VTEFVCRVKEENPDYLSACKDLPKYPGTQYCVLHFPGEKKKEDFEQVKKDKLEREHYDFSGTVFPEGTSDFSRCVFDGNADFTGATFIGEADFSSAQFSGEVTDFSEAQFDGKLTDFSGAEFSAGGTSFFQAQFGTGRIEFVGAQFCRETNFKEATFNNQPDFHDTTL
jgi:uncharacterized protein YjbI with pentapeptide repeats